MSLTTRDALLMPAARRFRELQLPVSNATVRIRSLLEREKEEFEASLLSARGAPSLARIRQARRRLIVLCLVDADGNALLRDEDADRLSALDAADISALHDACAELTGFAKADVETLVKNSEAALDD